jgi:hypothetical protein
MIVITFDPDEFNFVTVGDESYFLLRLPGGDRVLFKDRCAHRGGPLHLGDWDGDACRLVCPSHQTGYPEKVLRRLSAPLVYRNGRVTAVIDAPPQMEVRFARKVTLVRPEACEGARPAPRSQTSI